MKPNNNILFERYITPNLGEIASLTRYYTQRGNDYKDNYQDLLIEFFKYIHTYDNTKSLKTWLHISVRRYCQRKNKSLLRDDSVCDIDKVTIKPHYVTPYTFISDNTDIVNFFRTLTHTEKKIVLCLMYGYTIEKTSRELQMTYWICFSHIYYIRAKYWLFFKPESRFVAEAIRSPRIKKKLLRMAKISPRRIYQLMNTNKAKSLLL